MDTVSVEKRSFIMSRIRSQDTNPERAFKALLRGRLAAEQNVAELPGKPDFVFPNLRIVVQVDGCFFHGCPLHCKLPKTNTRFWANKIRQNKLRDRRTTRALGKCGFKVYHIWEHDLRSDSPSTRAMFIMTQVLRYV